MQDANQPRDRGRAKEKGSERKGTSSATQPSRGGRCGRETDREDKSNVSTFSSKKLAQIRGGNGSST